MRLPRFFSRIAPLNRSAALKPLQRLKVPALWKVKRRERGAPGARFAGRILAITNMYPSPSFPGRGVFVHEQVKGLRAIGLDVRVMIVDRWQEGPMAYYRMRGRIRHALAEFDPDVIHVMYGGVMADQALRRHWARPAVVTFHGSDLLGENLSGWKRKIISRYGILCSRRAARSAEGVIVVARHLLDALGGAAAPEKIRVIPCGIDLERFKPFDPLMCKQHLGWSPGAFHVLFASSNGDRVKRSWLARSAVAELDDSGRPSKFHCLSGLPNSEVPVWLNASDVLLLTSLHEGSPTVVKEALACGLPVVSVDVGDVAERIEGIEGCYLAPPQPADLAKKLRWVRESGKRLDCRAKLNELSLPSTAQKLKQLYENVTRRAGVGRRATPPVGASIKTQAWMNPTTESAKR